MSLFITFEGIEGSGKTTQVRRLKDALKLRGFDVVLSREPGGTLIGDQIRRILLDSENCRMVPLCELLLYAAARAQHVEEVIAPALKRGQIVVCDRFTDATLAYQGYARGFSLDVIHHLNQMAVGSHVPKITFLMDCDTELGLQRARARLARVEHGPLEDRFENEDMSFHQKVREGYLAIARANTERIVVLDASGDLEAVHRQILDKVLTLL